MINNERGGTQLAQLTAASFGSPPFSRFAGVHVLVLFLPKLFHTKNASKDRSLGLRCSVVAISASVCVLMRRLVPHTKSRKAGMVTRAPILLNA